MNSYEADSNQLLNELQALDFALVELTLYLGSHPYDENAIKQHNELAEKRHATRNVLENHNRESSTSEDSDSSGWRWSLTPWPWHV
ncbi:spore coat protein CotJB [Paenibacillus psychroresistens]|uniref:Spore coat protein CotJB n=2 Tax=Paenibacillus psychroresistens TaxID=1778678 RepID=A0A6B8RYB2_9BACL|nr:spore coat protein CotJB [Paenibacillus psychroresistens]QGR00077.1 spore coat protein CotJB [Paenibacillus psychroresistens]